MSTTRARRKPPNRLSPQLCITLPPSAHAKLEVLALAWRLPKSTVLAHLIGMADALDPPDVEELVSNA